MEPNTVCTSPGKSARGVMAIREMEVKSRVGADRPPGARGVVDDDGLAQPITKLFRDDSRHDVRRAAGSEADHWFDRTIRVFRLRNTWEGREKCRGSQAHKHLWSSHRVSRCSTPDSIHSSN